jgi:type IV pilus assembly protein PilC
MAIYKYKAIDNLGKTIRDEARAQNEAELGAILHKQGSILVSCSIKRESRLNLSLGANIKGKDIIQLCIHMEQLLDAGVHMLDGLQDVQESTSNKKLKNILAGVTQAVSEGKPLSKAFEEYPKTFGTVFTSLIAAGEESGDLTESFSQLINHYKRAEHTKTMVKKAITYPAVMMVVMFCIFYFMMVAVVPQLTSLLSSLGQELPLPTKALIVVSNFTENYKMSILLAPFVLFFTYKVGRLFEKFNYMIDAISLKIPVIGETIEKINISRFCHFFALMFQSGIPILQGLETATGVVSNRKIKKSLNLVKESVQSGEALSASMQKWGGYPPLVIRMIKVGEDSGRLGRTLNNVTDFYDREVEDTVEAMIGSLKIGLIAIVGLFVLWIVMSIIGPIYDSLSALNV